MSVADDELYTVLHAAFPSLPISSKVLERPPFSFLHALCCNALKSSGILTTAQLDLAQLTTRELKAGFLTRALAFVTFALQNAQKSFVSCLFLVSPVQVLAGLEVPRTHEFLYQLTHVCSLSDAPRAVASRQVIEKGEKELYTMAVSFRRGLVRGQAAVRGYLTRKHNKPTAVVGTRFLKEFKGFGVFEGFIKSTDGQNYVVYYPADEDEEELDADEMMQVLNQSRRLQLQQTQNHQQETHEEQEEQIDAPVDNNVFKALNAIFQQSSPTNETLPQKTKVASPKKARELSSKKEDNQEFIPAWQSKLLSLMQYPTESDTKATTLPPLDKLSYVSMFNSTNSASRHEAPVAPTPLLLHPPTLPKIHVPAQWSKRIRASKETNFAPLKKATMPSLTARQSNQKLSPPHRRKQVLQSLDDPEETFHDYMSQHRSKKSKVIYRIIQRIDRHLRRKHLRVVDLFRFCDVDGSGGISRSELEGALRQLDIQLPLHEVEVIMAHLDKNGNGVIDMDEFESLVRMNRRTDARRDQLRREFPQVIHSAIEASHQEMIDNWAVNVKRLLPYAPSILAAAIAIDKNETGSIPFPALEKIMRTMDLSKVRKEIIDDFLVLCRPVHNLVLISSIEAVFQDKPKRENKFLDSTWIAQFDAQMDKIRDLGL
ncbi:hypothetical protein THRCLA_02524 [Thraustotheca clavata]|uniref:EF-hand domain-containing protein n=1 Tax=Thraustotheca clavata TaxID=74557 RepID=A0A1W0A5L8_9STRA|nr:hypothetical protein THRCLA_02524 [Thraustotheca clavata]